MDTLKKLLILRHAKAELGLGVDDHARELTIKGRAYCEALAERLKMEGYVPDRVLCSTSARTRQTADIIINKLDLEPNQVSYFPEIYNANVTDLVSVFERNQEHALSIMLIGHNPSLESLVEFLAQNTPYDFILKPSSIAVMTTEQPWDELHRHSAQLVDLIHAKQCI
jgi:phosphohistidine phosphatase